MTYSDVITGASKGKPSVLDITSAHLGATCKNWAEALSGPALSCSVVEKPKLRKKKIISKD